MITHNLISLLWTLKCPPILSKRTHCTHTHAPSRNAHNTQRRLITYLVPDSALDGSVQPPSHRVLPLLLGACARNQTDDYSCPLGKWNATNPLLRFIYLNQEPDVDTEPKTRTRTQSQNQENHGLTLMTDTDETRILKSKVHSNSPLIIYTLISRA